MEMKYLKDEFSLVGTEEEAFKNGLEEITSMTKDFVAKASDVTFLSLCKIPKYQKEGRLAFYILSEDNLEHFRLLGDGLHCQSIQEERLEKGLVEELKEKDEMLALVHGNLYFVSNLAISTLMGRTGVTGDTTVARPNIFRDMHLADAAYSRNDNIHFVYREIGKMRKVFACLGGAYKLVPQTILLEILDRFRTEGMVGKIEVHDWSIDHAWTRIYLDFPDMANDFATMYKLPEKVIPGLLLQTSDLGLCSVTVRSTYRIGRSYVTADEVTQKHTLGANAEEIKKRVDDEIFSAIRKLPEALMELLGRYTYGSATTNLNNHLHANENRLATEQVIRYVMKRVIQPILSAKHATPLLESLILELNPEAHYTLYDIAILFMGLADRLSGVPKTTTERLRKACGTVPFLLLEYPKTPVLEEKEIFLLPA